MFEDRCEAERKYFGTKLRKKGGLSFDMNKFRDRIEERVDSIVPIETGKPSFEIKKFKFLYERLNKGVPIGAFCSEILNGSSEQYLQKINEIDKLVQKTPNIYNHDVEKIMESVLSRVTEQPCSTAEIINTGWLFKIERIYKNMINNLHDISPDNELNFKEDIRAMDDLLRNSIETAFLTKLFC